MSRTECVPQLPQEKTVRESISKIDPQIKIVGILEGGLNRNILLQAGEGSASSRFVLRLPRSQEECEVTRLALQKEYDAVGATENGIKVRFRTPQEQANFMDNARELGLKTAICLGTKGDAIVMEYVEGTPLNIYVQQEDKVDNVIIENVVRHMKQAHNKGIVFGDRWTSNTIITPCGDFVELDFDIELTGDEKTVISFELAQTLYHLIHFSGENRNVVKSALISIYARNPDLLAGYELKKVFTFMQKQAEYFYSNYQQNGNVYEGLIPPCTEVHDFVNGLGQHGQDALSRSQTEPIPIFESTENILK